MYEFGVMFLVVAVVACLCVDYVRVIAVKNRLLDHPNLRSSHLRPVPRLGGTAFVPVVLLAIAYYTPRISLPAEVLWSYYCGAIVLYGVSLLDDMISLPSGVRFIVQLIVAGVLLNALPYSVRNGSFGFLGFVHSTSSPITAFVSQGLLMVWLVGTVNIFNFMDGIDGIAGTQAVVAGISWAIFGMMFRVPFAAWAGAMVAAGSVGFLVLNWPPAKIFMGDAGSTVLGYIFAALPMVAIVESNGDLADQPILIVAALLLWPFLSDGAFTILRRLKKRENILKAHRCHLYQRLVIAGHSHALVTCVYGGLAAVGAMLAWGVVAKLPFAVPSALFVVGALFFVLWRWVVWAEAAKKNAS